MQHKCIAITLSLPIDEAKRLIRQEKNNNVFQSSRNARKTVVPPRIIINSAQLKENLANNISISQQLLIS